MGEAKAVSPRPTEKLGKSHVFFFFLGGGGTFMAWVLRKQQQQQQQQQQQPDIANNISTHWIHGTGIWKPTNLPYKSTIHVG